MRIMINDLVTLTGNAADRMVRLVTERRGGWRPPVEYTAERVAETVLRIVLGYRPPDLAEQAWKAR
jgi:hypothetical protein